MSESFQLDYTRCCTQCGAPEKVISKWIFVQHAKGGGISAKREVRIERSLLCGHSYIQTTPPTNFKGPAGNFTTDLDATQEPDHDAEEDFKGRHMMETQTWLPNSNNMALRTTNSNESLASQVPLAYHLPGGEVHFSPVTSHFPSPDTQFSAPSHQQTFHNPYNPSPLNPDQSSGSQNQEHHNNVVHGYHQPGTQIYQAPQSFQNHGQVNEYQHQPQHFQHAPGGMPSHGYSGYAQQPLVHSNLHQIQQYGGHSGLMTSHQPYQNQSYATAYGHDPSQYPHPQQIQQAAYRHGGQVMHYTQASNMGPPSDSHHPSSGYGYAGPSQNRPDASVYRSISNETYGSDIEEPTYKSSGFVPTSVAHNQPYDLQNVPSQQYAQYQPRDSQVFTPQHEAQDKPWGRHYQNSEGQDNEPKTLNVGVHSANRIYAGPFQQSISPRMTPATAPATDPLPVVRSGFNSLTGSPVKSKGRETPTQYSTNQATPGEAPPTAVQNSQNPTISLRSRKGQSISGLKIDPIRGPPPPFWPDAQPSIASSSGTLPQGSMHPSNNNSFIAGSAGPDPFITSGYAVPPQSMLGPVPQATQNPFGPAQTAVGPTLPISLPQQQPTGPSQHLAAIAPDGKLPSIEVALDAENLPFVETARLARPVTYGVVKISNIPYNVTRAEIVAFLGRNARIVNETEEPIHIIMERVTSKTMEAYIEFTNMYEAITAVNRYEVNRNGGRSGRLGERHVDLEVSGQEKLMAELFPKARNVRWVGSRPQIIPKDPNDRYSSGFQGFVTSEEIVMLVKHVETPQRSPFSKDCPQRPYECLISTLVKYPWYMVDHITLEARNLLYNASRDLVQILVNRLNEESDDEPSIHINDRLLRRLRTAVCRCPGFTEQQKDDIVFICGLDGGVAGLTRFADHWVAFKTIGPKPGIQPDVIFYYVALLREATTSSAVVSLAERAATENRHTSGKSKFFGNVAVEYPENVQKMSLADIAVLEWDVIEKLLRQRLEV